MPNARSAFRLFPVHLGSKLRFVVPQIFTGLRVGIGVWALFAAVLRDPELAAKLITIGVITDALDGRSARLLNAMSNFGGLFDMFSDYLYYIVVPGVISLLLTESGLGPFAIIILSLPFLTGAIRYAILSNLSLSESFQKLGTPGLATNVYTFFIVTLVFLKRDGVLQASALAQVLLYAVPAFSLLMIAPIRYPKLAKHNFVLIPVVGGLNLMPFVFSVPLAILSLVLISIYILFSPLTVSQRSIIDRMVLNRLK